MLEQEWIWDGILGNNHWGKSKRRRVQKSQRRMVREAAEDWGQLSKVKGRKAFEQEDG